MKEEGWGFYRARKFGYEKASVLNPGLMESGGIYSEAYCPICNKELIKENTPPEEWVNGKK